MLISQPLFDQLDDAATNIATMNHDEVAILLRRAAVRIRNQDGITFDQDVEEVLISLSIEHAISRKEMIRRVVRDALKSMGYWRVPIFTKTASSVPFV